MPEESALSPTLLTKEVRIMLPIWCIILVAWLPLFTLIGTAMAFDDADNIFDAYFFAVTASAYPVLVGAAFFFRRRNPAWIWWPSVPLMLMLLRYFGITGVR